jgi:hypothetical protein
MELFQKDFVPELNTKNLGNSPRFLTITHTTLSVERFRSYRILKSSFSASQILDSPDILVLDQVFGPQRGETCWGLNTKTGGNQLSFPTPTQTHVSDNRCNGYGRLTTAHVWSSAGRCNSEQRTVWGSFHGFGQRRLQLLLFLRKFID